MVVQIGCVPDCKWPKLLGDTTWPPFHGMQQYGACHILKHTNTALGDAILPMASYSTKGEMLIFRVTIGFE
jgi:hypothetical protein